MIVGGGWSGVGASLAVVQGGGEALLIERTDTLLGSGLVGGIMRNNGRYTAAEEGLAMGIDLFATIDRHSLHTNVDFPKHRHASLYDVSSIESVIQEELKRRGVEVYLQSRITGVDLKGKRILAVKDREGVRYEGDAFLDTTGTAGPMENCKKYGNGCVVCIYGCPYFGPRKSLGSMIGLRELVGERSFGQLGSMSGSCKLYKESLALDLVEELNEKGLYVAPLPEDLFSSSLLSMKACQQYAAREFGESMILLDTSNAKLMRPYFPLEALRRIPGFEEARYLDPLRGGVGNSIRYMGMLPVDDHLQVEGVENLFSAGEKAGTFVGHTEAIVTGTLAGRNALAYSLERELLRLPRSTAIGDAIGFAGERLRRGLGIRERFTFSGSLLFERMKSKGLYTIHRDRIRRRIRDTGMESIFSQELV